MTYCFIQAIERGQASTYGSMLNSMRSAIRNVGNGGGTGGIAGGGVVTSLLTMLVSGGSVVGGGLRQVKVLMKYIVVFMIIIPHRPTPIFQFPPIQGVRLR